MAVKEWLRQKATSIGQQAVEAQRTTVIQFGEDVRWSSLHTRRFLSGLFGVMIFSTISRYLFPLLGYPQNYWLIILVFGSFLTWAYIDFARTGTLLSRHYYGLMAAVFLLTFFFALIKIGIFLALGLTILHIIWRLAETKTLPWHDVLLAGVLLTIMSLAFFNLGLWNILLVAVTLVGIFYPKFSVTVILFLSIIFGVLFFFQQLPLQLITVVSTIILFGFFIVAFLLLGHESTKMEGGVWLVLYIFLVIGVWFGTFPGVEKQSVIGKGVTIMRESILRIPQSASLALRGFQRAYEQELAYAKGDYAASQIDEDAKRDLGVRMEELAQSEERLFEGAPVSFYTAVKAEALDKPVNIIASCEIDDQNVELLGCETKENSACKITVEGKETTSLDCVAESLQAGTHTAKISADFDFTTRSYLPVYLMEKNKLRELKRRGLDPLKGYDVKAPVATTTRGPVRVGVAVSEQPVGIGLQAGEPGPTIAVTIDNEWEGEVKAINSVILFLPRGIRITKVAGARVLGTPLKQSCEAIRQIDEQEARLCDETINAYTIMPEGSEETFGSFISFRAYTLVGEGLELGPAPITTRNIRVSVLYSYLLEKEKLFTVEEVHRERESELQPVTVAPSGQSAQAEESTEGQE